jgi:hypothetical protein
LSPFSEAQDAQRRAFENMAALWIAPWRAYWAVASEALDPANHGPRGA